MPKKPVPLIASDSPGLQRQAAIFEAGLVKKKPNLPIAFEDLEQKAKEEMSAEAYGYVAGGAGGEDTIRANRQAFERWRIVPRFLRDVSRRDLSVQVLGQTFPVSFMLAPVGVLGIVHKKAELAVARAARRFGVPMILSSFSSTSMEDVAAELADVARWFQLYWPADRDLAASFLQRAEAAGYSAIVLTVDTYLLAWRERDLQNAYVPFLRGDGMANYVSDPVFSRAVAASSEKGRIATIQHFLGTAVSPKLTWDDLAFVRSRTRLPLVAKGILHVDDARKALDHGVNGIIVSNHGGRQLDGAIAALDALPPVVDAVGKETTILFDSGIRRGADVLKAIALGARCVLLGRPYCYGLALGGENGVAEVLANLIADVDLSLGLAGCASCTELSRESLVAAPFTGATNRTREGCGYER